jgi:hypothetical protein
MRELSCHVQEALGTAVTRWPITRGVQSASSRHVRLLHDRIQICAIFVPNVSLLEILDFRAHEKSTMICSITNVRVAVILEAVVVICAC